MLTDESRGRSVLLTLYRVHCCLFLSCPTIESKSVTDDIRSYLPPSLRAAQSPVTPCGVHHKPPTPPGSPAVGTAGFPPPAARGVRAHPTRSVVVVYPPLIAPGMAPPPPQPPQTWRMAVQVGRPPLAEKEAPRRWGGGPGEGLWHARQRTTAHGRCRVRRPPGAAERWAAGRRRRRGAEHRRHRSFRAVPSSVGDRAGLSSQAEVSLVGRADGGGRPAAVRSDSTRGAVAIQEGGGADVEDTARICARHRAAARSPPSRARA